MKRLLIIVFMLALCLPVNAEAIKDLAGAGSGGGGGDMVSADFRYSAGATSTLTHSNISALEFQVDAFTCNIFDNAGFTGQPKEYSLIQTTVTLTDNMVNYIVADYNSGSPIVDVETNPDNFNGSRVPVMKVYAGGGVTHEMHMDGFGLGLSNKLNRRFISTQTYARESGLAISMQSAANTNFDVSAGKVWFGAQRISLGAVDSTTDDIHLVSPAGVVTSITAFDNNNYFNGETLTVVSNNQYAVNWVYRGVEVDEEVYIMLGDDSYTLNEAETAVAPSAPAVINSHAMLIGKVVFAKANPVPTSIQSAFDVVFAQAVATVHNDLSGLNVGDFLHLSAAEKIIAIAYDSVLFNTFVGGGALESATTGTYNVAIGDTALDNLTTGIGNVAIGRLAGNGGLIGWTDSVTDTYMTFVGINTSRDNNTANSTAFTYSTALGAGAKVSKSNQMVFGTSANTENKFYGDILVDDAVIATFTAGEKLIALYGSLIRDFEAKHIDAESATFTAGIEVNNATFTGDVSFDGATVTGLPTADPLYDALDNTFVGETGIPAVTTGYDNTLMGKDALKDLTTGYHNVAVGAGSLVGNTTGYDNVAMGFESLGFSSISNWGNVAIGKYSMKNNRGGDGNVAIGYQSMYYNPTTYFTGNDNVAVGNRAGGQMTSGSGNVALGKSSMYSNNTGSKNVAIGQEALNTGVGGENNIGIGYGSGRNDGNYNISLGNYNLISGHTTADHNIAMGKYSLKSLTAGDDNIAIGQNAFENLTTTSNNTAIGKAAGFGATSGYSDSKTDSNMTFLGALASRDSTIANSTAFTNSTALGYNARVSKSNQMVFGTSANTENLFYGAIYKDGVELVAGVPTYDANENTFVGEDALTALAGGSQNTAMGKDALSSLTTGSNNIAIGWDTLSAATSASSNIAIGNGALNHVTGTADNNMAIGAYALTSNTTGSGNFAIGAYALQDNLTSSDNVAVGPGALKDFTSGTYNTAVGRNAMGLATGGDSNTALGYGALYDCTYGGNYNNAIGQSALANLTTGDYNNALGNDALTTLTTGNSNVGIGYSALYSITTTDDNTAIGMRAGFGDTVGYSNSVTDSKMTFIGKYASRDSAIANSTVFTNSTAVGYNARVSKSNQIVLGDDNVTETVLKGDVVFEGATATTGAGSAALGSNCPAVTVTAPYTWLKIILPDGSTGYIPVYK